MSDSVQKYSASRMGSAPIGPLLLSCSVPMMISMLVQALYNIVDSIFVSRVNEAALSAVSLAFPIQNLMIAFAVGTAVGVNAYLSRCLGEGNRAEASRAAMNGLFLAFCGGIAFLVFGILGARASLRPRLPMPRSCSTVPIIFPSARYGAWACSCSACWKNCWSPPAQCVRHGQPADWRFGQHCAGSHLHLRSVRRAPHGSSRCCCGYRSRAVDRRSCRADDEPAVQ